MPTFPVWSDLGNEPESPTASDWAAMLNKLELRWQYYSGEVFEEVIQKEKPTDPDMLLFPAGINLAKSFCTMLADAMYGEWGDAPVILSPSKEEDGSKDGEKAVELAYAIIRESGGHSLLWELELDRNVFGGCAIRIGVGNNEHHVKLSRVQRGTFMPVWDPEDPDKLLEAWVVSSMSAVQAKLKFGKDFGDNRDVEYVEHWTESKIETFLDKVKLRSEANPYGVVPFVYIPRARSGDWYGESLIDDLMAIQDEINMRVADIGAVTASNAHPIKWGVNMPRAFSRETYPVHSDAMWDLGREHGGLKPEVGILEPKSAFMEVVFSHIQFMMRRGRELAGIPSIAFGEDEGGGQRSGDTLEIRLRPLQAVIKRQRAYMIAGLLRVFQVVAAIYKQKAYNDIPARAAAKLPTLSVSFADILPRRKSEVVDMVVKLLSTTPPSISLETAVEWLGMSAGEIERIKKMLADSALQAPLPQEDDALGNPKDSVPDGRALPVSGRESKTGSAEDSK